MAISARIHRGPPEPKFDRAQPGWIEATFDQEIELEEAREALRKAPGIVLFDHPVDEGYVTPAECVGEDGVFVSRLRSDPTVEFGLNMWVVSDNLRKGAALNAVQIAERLVEDYI